MDPIAVGVLGTLLLAILLMMGMPIAFMMMLVGFISSVRKIAGRQ